ncbi:MAG: hypothetical protein ACJ8G2_04255 [Burkholderiales bacterium]|jgi:hypothetical protein
MSGTGVQSRAPNYWKTADRQMQKVAQWRFEKVAEHSWYWERIQDEHARTRIGPFPTFTACLMDARQQGFNAGMSERRRIPRDPQPPLFSR